MIIIFFTRSYPYDAFPDKNFLEQEVKYLSENFDQLFIVPSVCKGTRHAVPPGVIVDESYALEIQKQSRIFGKSIQNLFSKSFYKEIMSDPSILLYPDKLTRLIFFLNTARITQKWVCSLIKDKQIDPRESIFYTYWFNDVTLGIGLAKKYYSKIGLISRAHGGDIYIERHRHSYIPCRFPTFDGLDGLFPDSNEGTNYISSRYPKYAHICETSRLGVPDPGFISPHSNDGVFRLVSCSRLKPVKRVDLIVMGLRHAAQTRPEINFEWHHFGTAPLTSNIESIAREYLPGNVRAHFPGYPSLEYLLLFYKNNPVDVFLNVSETEGTPVAVMEAISCGIPVIATAVGGNKEIVSELNGELLNPNPTPEEIAEAILKIWDHPDLALEKRKQSRQIWQKHYNDEQNFSFFIKRLKSIRLKKSDHQIFAQQKRNR